VREGELSPHTFPPKGTKRSPVSPGRGFFFAIPECELRDMEGL
jgi:hypothetical protein